VEVAMPNRKHIIKHGAACGGKTTPEYRSWHGLRGRCNNPTHQDYENYGGRGIRVCERWDRFENFLADMGSRPPGYSIERIDVNGHYEPANCKWIPLSEQSKNRRWFRSAHYRDLVGQAFGRLRVMADAGRDKHGKVLWLCECICHATVTVTTGLLASGKTRSCGCLHREQLIERNSKRRR
jgi:hypothetical protein